MVISNSYVKLPEGRISKKNEQDPGEIPWELYQEQSGKSMEIKRF